MPSRVGIDIDGVLYPWTDAANQVCMQEFGIPDPGSHTTWYHLKDKVTGEQWKWVWSPEGMRKIFGTLRTYPNADMFRGLLDDPRLECHFVTHRDPAILAGITADFLTYLFPDSSWEGLIVTKGTPKIALYDWDYFVDDRSETVAEFLDGTDTFVFMPNRPWNTVTQGYYHWNERLYIYNDPQEVVDKIKDSL